MTHPEPFTAAFDAIDRLKDAVTRLAQQREQYRILADTVTVERDMWRAQAEKEGS